MSSRPFVQGVQKRILAKQTKVFESVFGGKWRGCLRDAASVTQIYEDTRLTKWTFLDTLSFKGSKQGLFKFEKCQNVRNNDFQNWPFEQIWHQVQIPAEGGRISKKMVCTSVKAFF